MPLGGLSACTFLGDKSCHLQMLAGTSLVVQWLRLCASTAGGAGSSLVGEVPHGARCGQKKKKLAVCRALRILR